MTDDLPIALSLMTSTNAGKTTLARTLLSRDVGEIRDAPHVTTEAAFFRLIDTGNGDALILGTRLALATVHVSCGGCGSRAIPSVGSCRKRGIAFATGRSG